MWRSLRSSPCDQILSMLFGLWETFQYFPLRTRFWGADILHWWMFTSKNILKKNALHRPGIGQEKPIGPAKTRGASLPDGDCLTEDTGMVEKR